MSSREAKIKLIAEGAGRARSEVNSVSDAVKNLGSVGSVAQKALAEIGKAAFHAASDAARAMNDVKPLDFGSAADKTKSFEDVVTRLALRGGQDVESLGRKFRTIGTSIGKSPEELAKMAGQLQKMTFASDPSEAMRALANEADDSNRSLSEMVELGATLYNKMGVPMDQVGKSIAHIRDVANEFKTVGGHLALEDSLRRSSDLLAKLGFDLKSSAIVTASYGRGLSPEVATRVNQDILGTFAGTDPKLLEKFLGKDFKLRRDSRGDVTYDPQTLAQIRDRMLRKDQGQVQRFFTDRLGQAGYLAYERFIQTDTRQEIQQAEKKEARVKDQQSLQDFKRRVADLSKPTGPTGTGLGAADLSGLIDSLPPVIPSRFSGTKAGQRAKADQERAEVEAQVGEQIQSQRDKRNELYRGRRGLQAVVDTTKGYLPSTAERAFDIAEATVVAASPSQARTPMIELSPSSIAGIGKAVQANPPPRPASEAVEANKARNRSLGAN